MRPLFHSIILSFFFLSVPALGSQTIFKVLEKDDAGDSTHRALDRSEIGDGLDPILQFILLETPQDPDTLQVVWEASEKPIPWARNAEEVPYRMVEYAVFPAEGSLEYRIFFVPTGDELTSLRHTRDAEDGELGVDPAIVNNLNDGLYDIHAHLIVPERPTSVLKQRIEVSDDVQDEIEPDEPESDTPQLEPGSGWKGPTKEPAQIGNVPYETIARWNVVPEQSVEAGFTVGVIAHHIEGIDRVEIAVNGGPWIEAKLDVNPRTKSKEYFAELGGVDGELEVRAIAYPTEGKPRLLEPLALNQPELVIDLPAGEIDARSLVRPLPEKGWLIFRGHPDGTTLVGGSRIWNGHVKFEGLTWKPGEGGGMALGGDGSEDWIWLDQVKIVGNGRDNTTWWTTHMWGRSIFTDCEITKLQNVFHGGAGSLLARNVKIHDCYEDVFRSFGLAVNIEIDGIDRGEKDYHPAMCSFAGNWTQSNVIFQNITGNDVKSQGLAGSRVNGLAVVDCDIRFPGWSAFQMHSLENVLIQGSDLIGGGQFQNKGKGFAGVVLRNSRVGWQAPFLPANWDRPGVKVLDHPVKIDK